MTLNDREEDETMSGAVWISYRHIVMIEETKDGCRITFVTGESLDSNTPYCEMVKRVDGELRR